MLAAQHAPIGAKNLHQQGNQDYGKKILQPPAHRKPIRVRTNHHESPKSRSGSPVCPAVLPK